MASHRGGFLVILSIILAPADRSLADEVFNLALSIPADRHVVVGLEPGINLPSDFEGETIYHIDPLRPAPHVAASISQLMQSDGKIYVISPQSARGIAIGTQLARQCGANLLAGVIRGSNHERVVIPLYGGQVLAHLSVDDSRLVLIPAAQPGPTSCITWREPKGSVPLPAVPNPPVVPSLEILSEERDADLPLSSAAFVISGGRGLGGPEGFEALQHLAQAMGGVVGASRAAVDAGWVDQRHQVGQTGISVAPSLYFAIGISGAIQHLAGIRQARRIIAINQDPNAPIFRHADFGVVGDYAAVVEGMLAELERKG
jgi:electron transfer flavoprotein alpha subunit